MEEAAPGARIQLLDRDEPVAGTQPMDRLEKESVGTGSQPLQRRRRIATPHHLLVPKDLEGLVRRLEQSVCGVETPRLPARPAGPQRPRQALVLLEQKTTLSPHSARAGAQQRRQQGQVVLGIVDRLRALVRSRPAQRRLRPRRLDLVESREAAFSGAQQIQSIERRHPRPTLDLIDARKRSHDPGLGRLERPSEKRTFVARPVSLERQSRIEAYSIEVQEQRVLQDLAREESFCQARHEHGVETSTQGVGNSAHEHPTVAQAGRLVVQHREPLAQALANLFERHRPDRSHRAQAREETDHVVRIPQNPTGESLERLDPFVPGSRGRQLAQMIDHRQHEATKRLQLRDSRLEVSLGRLFVVFDIVELQEELLLQSVETRLPALFAAHDRSVHEQALPASGRTNRLCQPRLGLRGRLQRLEHELITIGLHPFHFTQRNRARWVDLGNFPERKELREARCGKAFRGARQQREEGTTGGIRPHRAR